MPRHATLPLHKIVFHCAHLHPEHVHVTDPTLELSTGPIEVEALLQGEFYVHNGRHRVLRAREAGEAWIDAVVMNQVDEEEDSPATRALISIYNAWAAGIPFRQAVHEGSMLVNGTHDQAATFGQILADREWLIEEMDDEPEDGAVYVQPVPRKSGRHRG